MRIGIPRALLYYKYSLFWERFFGGLGHEVVVSKATDSLTFKDGQNLSIDENCVPCKIFMGHVQSLTKACDCIFVPRIVNFSAKESACVKFNALFDIARNVFPDIRFITCSINGFRRQNQRQAYIGLAEQLGAKRKTAEKCYEYSMYVYEKDVINKHAELEKTLDGGGVKVMIAANAYTSFDSFAGGEVAPLLNKAGIRTVYSSDVHPVLSRYAAREFSKTIYWAFTKETLGAVAITKERLDGVVFLTAFPCGQEALANELAMRKLKIPSINIVIDSNLGRAGLVTRLESFADMLQAKNLATKVI